MTSFVRMSSIIGGKARVEKYLLLDAPKREGGIMAAKICWSQYLTQVHPKNKRSLDDDSDGKHNYSSPDRKRYRRTVGM
eukprot:scaffold609_cov170-Amphora_coffeaeformis.AAC.55